MSLLDTLHMGRRYAMTVSLRGQAPLDRQPWQRHLVKPTREDMLAYAKQSLPLLQAVEDRDDEVFTVRLFSRVRRRSSRAPELERTRPHRVAAVHFELVQLHQTIYAIRPID